MPRLGALAGQVPAAPLDSTHAWLFRLPARPAARRYLENAAGHHWLAARVPDDSVFVSGNQARFQEVDLTTAPDSLILSSPGLLEFAIKSRLYDPAAGPFNFFRAFQADAKVDASANCEPAADRLRGRGRGRACLS